MSCRHIIGVNVTHIISNNVFLSIHILTVLIFLFRKVSKEFHLDYDKLEDRPSLPTNLSSSSGTVASSGSGVAGVGTGSASVHQPSSNSPAPPGMPGGGGAPHPAGGPGGIPPSTPSSASQHSPIGGVVAPGLNAVGGGPNL